jgi:hypothetical protein
MKKFLVLFLIAALVCSPAFASVRIQEDAVDEGDVTEINASTGLGVAVVGRTATVTVDSLTAANLASGSVVYGAELPGFVVAAGANTACTTTCGISTAICGLDAATHVIVATNSALADSCLCNGAVS